MKRVLLAAVVAAALATGAAAASGPSLLNPASLHAKAPTAFKARFGTTKGAFVVTVHRLDQAGSSRPLAAGEPGKVARPFAAGF